MPTHVNTMLVTISAGSRQINETINQNTPPKANSIGPTGYSSGNPALTNVPTINMAVAIHLRIRSIFICFISVKNSVDHIVYSHEVSTLGHVFDSSCSYISASASDSAQYLFHSVFHRTFVV